MISTVAKPNYVVRYQMVVSRMYMCVKPGLEMCNELMLCEFMHSYTVIVIVTGSRSSLCSQVHMCIDIFTHTYTYIHIRANTPL